MKIVLFYHSLISDWNHGNAHFLRGVATNLIQRGHEVRRLRARERLERAEPRRRTRRRRRSTNFTPAIRCSNRIRYELATLDLDRALDGADLVIVHEWNDHALVRRIGEHRAAAARRLPALLSRYPPSRRHRARADGGATICRTTTACSPTATCCAIFIWHAVGRPAPGPGTRPPTRRCFIRCRRRTSWTGDVVWIGNWGDEERARGTARVFDRSHRRTRAARAGLSACVIPGMRARCCARPKIRYGGWLPELPRAGSFCPLQGYGPCPAASVRRGVAGHPDDPALRGAGVRHPARLLAMERRGKSLHPGRDFLVARDGAGNAKAPPRAARGQTDGA